MNVRAVIEGYRVGILSSYEPTQMTTEQYDMQFPGNLIVLRHLAWMCDEKAHRWLGYIQGELRVQCQ